jgi:hypothetical protein
MRVRAHAILRTTILERADGATRQKGDYQVKPEP